MAGRKQSLSIAIILRYAITGVGTAGVYIVAGAALHYGFGLTVTWSTTFAFALSVVFNYLLHYHFTFRTDHAHRQVIPRYMSMIVGGGAINWGVSEFGQVLAYSLPAIQAANIILIVLWNFALSQRWVFRS